MKIDISLLIPFLIILFGCNSTNLTITKKTENIYLDTINYATFWSAMRFGLPDLVKNYNPDTDELEFAKGLSELINGQYDKSEDTFEKLLLKSKNDTVNENSKIILSQLYLYQSKWEKYYDLLRDKSKNDSSEIERLLYPSFMGLNTSHEFTKHADTIPIKFYKGLILVPVTLNGNNYEFLFDTGLQLTTISSDIAKKNNVKILNMQNKAMIGSTGELSDGFTASIDEFEFGNYKIRHLPCFSTDVKNLQLKFIFLKNMNFEGIIGWDIIKNLDLEIDYKSRNMIIRKPKNRVIDNKNLFWLNDPFVKLKNKEGIDLLFFLDLGAQSSCFYDFLIRKINKTEIENSYMINFGIGGSIFHSVRSIPEITLIFENYFLNFKNLKEGFAHKDQFIVLDGSLGNDIGKNILRIDASNSVIELK